jgi:CheY-like chemotaxis protein
MAGKKILLIDDSRTVLMMESMLLVQRGYEIVTAADGVEGVAKAASDQPDLILMDLMMPNMDGFEACRRLRESEATRDIPVIMVTTKSEVERVKTAGELGCQGYVTKPVNGPELVAKVKALLGN